MKKIKQWWEEVDGTRMSSAIWKEFRIPLAIALWMVLLGVSSESIRAAQNYFFGFFMVAWFTGQWVRIQRELDRRDSSAATLQRLEALSQSLSDQAERIAGYATGGNSVAKIVAHAGRTQDKLEIEIVNLGEYSLHHLECYLVQRSTGSTVMKWKEPLLTPNRGAIAFSIDVTNMNDAAYFMFTMALNHTLTTDIILARAEDGSHRAACRSRVGNEAEWRYDVPKDYPGIESIGREAIFEHPTGVKT